ncbi:metallophosphoesterase family protein [Ornithinibacillus halophilus]|uniref:PhoD-like phosphatase n=1 Tax=Ornithinibacillus halophilus TaxID=930117 RepID=A0A1M5LZB6_9BACI|nr:hypothetical protein [Ornithinibacillus halophilus]SHG70434.1 hypothetical protein SAMN05216225_105215 [Ornithinibacillus halophilus]
MKLYNIDHSKQSINYEPIQTTTINKTIKSGNNLFISLLEVNPIQGTFPIDEFIGYNLEFSTMNRKNFDLDTLGLLTSGHPQSIVYGDFDFPTFIIQKNAPNNILYGSCQKPHGKNQNVFPSADQSIEENFSTIKKRPNSLFLMGDQIYADDVADPIFPVVSKWSQALIGEDKRGLYSVDRRLQTTPFRKAIDRINGRQYTLENISHLTSNSAHNHLIRYSEYMTMYLLTLGPTLWENVEIPSFDDLVKNDNYYFIYPDNKKNKRNHKKERKKYNKRFNTEQKELANYVNTLSSVRRVLANTPTYMIFDDHDITDDWNISREWKKDVYQSPLGRYIVTNGLTAYWLVQAWGNDPDTFTPYANKIRYYLNRYLVTARFDEEWEKHLLSFHSWSFVAPTNPRSLFLDIRTMRRYDIEPQPLRIGRYIGEGNNAAQLISRRGWNRISSTLEKSNWRYHDPIILVSPTPLYGIGLIESFLNKFVYPFRLLGLPVNYNLDFEAWKYNGKGFNLFLQQLAKWNPQTCIILSGDVHYASAVKSKVTFTNKRELNIHQFTSSPIHNMSFSGLWGLLLKIVIWFNAQKRKRRTIHRYCDNFDRLQINSEKLELKKRYKWHEEIKYLTTSRGSIIETKNNIGLLQLTKNQMKNKLITAKVNPNKGIQ